jgi:indole-3-glycerol phosphate synthase
LRFAEALRDGFGAIAEFKRRSPSAGDLRPDGDVAEVARTYEANGARAMSVLVDERFAGSWDDLRAARATTTLPLLAKGFFSTPGHLRTAREAGADAALADPPRPRRRDVRVAAAGGGGARARHTRRGHDAAELERATTLGRARDRGSTPATSRRSGSTATRSSRCWGAHRETGSSSPSRRSRRVRTEQPPS